jgi:hypothetical protein
MIRDRVSAGKLQKKKVGRHIHGRVPYGYRSGGGILEPVEDLVPVVRRIYRDARVQGPDEESSGRRGVSTLGASSVRLRPGAPASRLGETFGHTTEGAPAKPKPLQAAGLGMLDVVEIRLDGSSLN